MSRADYEADTDEIAKGINPKKLRVLEAATQSDEDDVTTRDITKYAGYSSNELRHWFRQCVGERLLDQVGKADDHTEGYIWQITGRGKAVLDAVEQETESGPETITELGNRLSAVEAQSDATTMQVKRLSEQIESADLGTDHGDDIERASKAADQIELVEERLGSLDDRVDRLSEQVEQVDTGLDVESMLLEIMDAIEDLEERVQRIEE